MFTRTSAQRFLVGLIVSATPMVVFAAGQHYTKGNTPSCAPKTNTVTSSTYTGSCTGGEAAGLGHNDIHIAVTIKGSADQFCVNGGGNEAPGQNPAVGTFVTPLDIPGSAVKNGKATIPPIPATGTFSFTVGPSSVEDAGCPEGYKNGYVRVGDAKWTGLYSFQQPTGNQIDSLSFAF